MLPSCFGLPLQFLLNIWQKHAIDGTEISQNVVHYHGGSFTKDKINLV